MIIKHKIVSACVSAGLLGTAFAGLDAKTVESLVPEEKPSFFDRFDIGSYGELHARVGDGDDNIDLHRMVLLLNVQITDNIRFVSELEFEHFYYWDEAGNDKTKKIEVEQAYFEFTLPNDFLLNAGVQLVPIGLVNITHEPTTFYGVERPNVEKYIVPSTWWELGMGGVKTFENGVQVDVMVHSSLDMTSDGYVRSGRPKLDWGDYEDIHSWAVTSRVKYTGIAGLELSGALQFQQDVSSSLAGNQTGWLAETHAVYRKGGFELRGLASYWFLNGFEDGDIDGQWGYYIEPSYRFETPLGDLGFFGRFSQYDYFKGSRNSYTEYTVGSNLWVTENVVLKVDYSAIDKGSKNANTFNFGVGYFF